MNEKNQTPGNSYSSPTTSAAAEAAAFTRIPQPVQHGMSFTTNNASTSRQISNDPHSAAIATTQLYAMGFDRKIAEALSKQKLTTKSAVVTTAEKPILNVNQTLQLQQASHQPQLITPSERLIQAKKILNLKLLTKGSSLSTITTAAVPVAIISRPTTTIATQNIKTITSGRTPTSTAAALKKVDETNLNKTNVILNTRAHTKLPTQQIKKLPVKKIQMPQEIARVLDFDGANSNINVQSISSTSKVSNAKIPSKLPVKAGNSLAEKVPTKEPHEKDPQSLMLRTSNSSVEQVPQKLPVKAGNSLVVKERHRLQRQPKFVDKFQTIDVLPKNSQTYAESFKNFIDIKQPIAYGEKGNNDIPKASIRKSFDNRSIPPTSLKVANNEPKSFKNADCLGISPLKLPFPTTTLPQEAPLPTISTFKKPFLPQRGIAAPVNYEVPDTQQHTTKSLIVLEDKVLSHEEKIDLTTVFGLAEPSPSQLPMPLPKQIIVKEEKHDDMQSFNLPAIGETVSTDPNRGIVVVNPTQPKKFIIAPDKLKLSKDKIAALAKQIKTQVTQKSIKKKVTDTELKNKVLTTKRKQNIEIPTICPSGMDNLPKNIKSIQNNSTQQSYVIQKEAVKFAQNMANIDNSYNIAPIPILYGDTVVNFENTSLMKVKEPENMLMFNTSNDANIVGKSNSTSVVTKIKTIENYPTSENLVSTNTSTETIQQYGTINAATQNSPSLFEEKPTTFFVKPLTKSIRVNDKPIVISSQNAKPIIISSQNPAFKVIVQNSSAIKSTAGAEGSNVLNAALDLKTLNNDVTDNLVPKPLTKIILLKIPNASTTSVNTLSASVQSTISNFDIQNLKPVRTNVNKESKKLEPVRTNVNKKDKLGFYEKPSTSSKIVQTTTTRKQSAVCVINENGLNSNLSAVDFIASLTASNSFNENYTLELSAEERNLNDSLNIYSSGKSLLESEKMLLENVTLTENVSKQKNNNDLDATALITQMFDKDNSKDLLNEKYDQAKKEAFNHHTLKEYIQFTVNTSLDHFNDNDIINNNDESENARTVDGLNNEVIEVHANEITNNSQLKLDEINDQQKQLKEIFNVVEAPSVENVSDHVVNKVSNIPDTQNYKGNLCQPDQVIQSSEITHENKQMNEESMIESNNIHKKKLSEQDIVSETLKICEPKVIEQLREEICDIIEDRKNLVENIKHHFEQSKHSKIVPNEQSSSSNRQPLRLKKGKINLVQRKKTNTLTEGNKEQEQTENQDDVQYRAIEQVQKDLNAENLNEEVKTTEKSDFESLETLQTKNATDSHDLPEFEKTANTQNEIEKMMETQSRESRFPKLTKTYARRSQNVLQDIQTQKDKETEVAKVLVSLIQPPAESDENILKPAINPFKRNSLKTKINEGTVDISSLINQIEVNKLQEEKARDDALTNDVTIEQQKTMKSTDHCLKLVEKLTEANTSIEKLSESIEKVIHSKPNERCRHNSNTIETVIKESSQYFETGSEPKTTKCGIHKINKNENSTVDLQAISKTISTQHSEPITVNKGFEEVQQMLSNRKANSLYAKNKILNTDKDLEETTNNDLNENYQNKELTGLCYEKETVTHPNKMSTRNSKSGVGVIDTETIQVSRKNLRSTATVPTCLSNSTTKIMQSIDIHIDEEFVDETNENYIDSFLNNNEDKSTDHQQNIIPDIRDENKRTICSEALQNPKTDRNQSENMEKLVNTSILQKIFEEDIKSRKKECQDYKIKIEKAHQAIVAGKITSENNSNIHLDKIAHNKISSASITANKLQEQIKLVKINKKHRIDSKISNADTQSDIDITDLDVSNRESNDETAKEDSSQEHVVTRSIRKRLRKTVEDVKRGRTVNTETDTDDEHFNSNPDSNEFLGFDEAIHCRNKIEEKLKILISATSAEEEEEEKKCADEQIKIKDKKLAEGLSRCHSTDKNFAANNKSIPSVKITSKIMPLKKRWELVHESPTVETDITDDTSPANDDDDDNDATNILIGNKEHETMTLKVAQKRHYDELKSPSESQVIKKPKLFTERKTGKHVFVEPQPLRTIKLSPSGTPEKEFISNNEIVKSYVDDANLIEEVRTMLKEKRRGRPPKKFLEATSGAISIASHLKTRARKSDSTVIASKLVILSEPPVIRALECAAPYEAKTRARKPKKLDNTAVSNEEENVELNSVESCNNKLNEPKSIIEIFTTSKNLKVSTNSENIEEPSISKPSKKNSTVADKKKKTYEPKFTPAEASDVIQSHPIQNAVSKTVLDAVPLITTGIENKKRRRESKSSAFDSNGILRLGTKVAEESYAVSNISMQTPKKYNESESVATTAEKKKRRRKSKLSILECNDMSWSGTEVDGENFVVSNTLKQTPGTVRSTLLRKPETYFATEPVETVGGKKKRERKSNLSTLAFNDINQPGTEVDGENFAAATTFKQTPEMYAEFDSVVISVEKKKRGRKPKVELDNSGNQISATADTGNISHLQESTIITKPQLTTAAANVAAEKKKPGRKRIHVVASESDTSLLVTPEIFNVRLLLISSRSQLETNEKLTADDGKPAAGSVKCGLCLGNSRKEKWLQHLGEHYGIGWINGEPALELTNRYVVLNTMTNYYKQTKVKGLNCRLCKNLYRSALGLLIHVESCGLSAEEQKKNRVSCSFCNNSYTKLSLTNHVRACPARIAAEKAKNVVNADEGPTEEILNNIGRVKRVSLIKAENIIKKIREELTTTSFDPTQYIKFVESCIDTDWQSKCQGEMIKFGKLFCPQVLCKFFCTDLTKMEDHINTCKYIPKAGYHCTLCNRQTIVFKTNELALHHINKVHKPRETGDDFKSDSSECDLGNESTGDDDSCSSGVDSNEENIVSEQEDDIVNSETGSIKKKSSRKIKNKKKQQQRKRSLVPRPQQNESRFKPVFPSRYSNVDKHVVNCWKEFIFQNYTLDDVLFSNLTPKIFRLDSEKESQLEKSLPRHNESIKFSFTSFKNIKNSFGAPASETIEWLELKRFETHVWKADLFTFIGAPIKALAWAPLPEKTEHQFLAISYRKDMNKFTRFLQPKIEPTHILIHKINILADNNVDKVKLHYALHIAEGPVHSFEFLPSGGYAPALNRLGLLAVATALNNIHVYSLPLEIAENSKLQEKNLLKLNVIYLQSAFVLSLNLNSMMPDISTEVQCLKLKWSEFRGHNLIFAGFSNGFVGTWDISDDVDENLNRFVVNDMRHFLPLNYFFCGEKTIQDMALHYDTNGPRWLAISAFGRTLLVLDLMDLTNPFIIRNEIAKNIISSLDWPLMWENFVMPLGSALQNNGESLLIKSTMGLQFSSSKVQVVPGGATQAKFNPWYSLYVITSEHGDLVFQKMREMHFESNDLRGKSNMKVVATSDVKYLNGKAMHEPPSNTKTNVADSVDWQMFEDDYKEKYGLIFTSFAKLPCSENFSEKRHPPENITRYMRINCVSWNLNSNARNLLACGYENGFLRILNFKTSEYFNYKN